MNRRNLLKTIFGLAGFGLVATKVQAKTLIRIQSSSVAGFQFYQGAKVWHQINEGDTLTLKAESTNKYNRNAGEIYWQDQKLGYLPRDEDYEISQMLLSKQKLIGTIQQKQMKSSPWQRVQMSVELFL